MYNQQPGYPQPGYNPPAYNAPPPPAYVAGEGMQYGAGGGMPPPPPPPPAYGAGPGMPPRAGPPRRQFLPMPMPTNLPPGCPPSLAYLAHIDGLVVQQELEQLELLLGIETANTYRLLNRMGQRVYYAMEESGGCDRQCNGSKRSLVTHVVDNMGAKIIRCFRPYVCCWERQSIRIESPPGNVVAFVRDSTCCGADYMVMDANSVPQLMIRGPGGCDCNMDRVFQVFDMSMAPIGEIRKMFSGFLQEALTDADNFGVSFPPTLPVQMKAALIGTTFLISVKNHANPFSFMYFESSPGDHQHDKI